MKTPPDMSGTALAKSLADVAAIKREMIELLVELETRATGRRPAKPGVWRHHPVEWAEQNPPPAL